MALKLVTSKAYVNNIRNFLPEKPNSKTPASEKSRKVFEQIINSPNFIFDKSDTKLTDYITTLLSIRPGRTLFKRLLKADKPLQIVLDSEYRSVSQYNTREKSQKIILNDSKVSYHFCVNPAGEKQFSCNHAYITLAHELIHALHYFEEGPEFVIEKRKKEAPLATDLDNLEEQETIIGKDEEAALCENVFRFHFGYPLRINHRGATSFTAIDCAEQGIVGNLREMALTNPSLLNLPQSSSSGFKLTPLNAAIRAKQSEVVDYLLESGVDLNAMDECHGTVLHTARAHEPSLIEKLLQKGADPNAKDRNGFTALEEALFRKDDMAAEILAPHTNLKELDKDGHSILCCVCNIATSEGFRILIQHGADVNNKDWQGNTPIMECCKFNDYESGGPEKFKQIFQLLLANDHLDLNAKNTSGESALSLAVKNGHYWQVDALVKKGAEVPPHLKDKVEHCIDQYNQGVDDEIELLFEDDISDPDDNY